MATYTAKEYTLESLFTNFKKLEVPQFQRLYQWSDDELNYLFDDVANNEYHFMGALVFCKTNTQKHFLILDGQQRLTTITILIAVLVDKLKELSDNNSDKADIARSSRDLLFAERRASKKKERTPIIRPQEEDEIIYSMVIRGNNTNDLKSDILNLVDGKKLVKRRIFKAYEFFKERVDNDFVKKAIENRSDPFELITDIVDRLYENLTFVVIESEDESAAFRLFETLNGRGLDLSAADLIKNKLFSICRPADLENFKKKWAKLTSFESVGNDLVAFFRTKWLSDNSIRRKNKDGDIEKHEFIRKDDLFEAYRDYFDLNKSKPNFVQKTFDDLLISAEAYNEIISPGSKSVFKTKLDAISVLGAKTCRPLLMIVFLRYKSIFNEVAELIEFLTVRWIVSKQGTNVLETNYARIASNVSQMHMDEVDVTKVLDYIGSELHKLDVPNDKKFKDDFSLWKPSNTSRLARYVLIEINKYISPTKELNISGTDDVEVEHIFPQSPSSEAMEESKISDDEAETWSSMIGNLTLLDAAINNHVKNDKFSKKISLSGNPKKNTLANSVLAINKELKNKKYWLKDDISERSRTFADYAVQIWKW